MRGCTKIYKIPNEIIGQELSIFAVNDQIEGYKEGRKEPMEETRIPKTAVQTQGKERFGTASKKMELRQEQVDRPKLRKASGEGLDLS